MLKWNIKSFEKKQKQVIYEIGILKQPNTETILNKSFKKADNLYSILSVIILGVMFILYNFYSKDITSELFYLILFTFFAIVSGSNYYNSIIKMSDNIVKSNKLEANEIIKKNLNYIFFRFNCLTTVMFILMPIYQLLVSNIFHLKILSKYIGTQLGLSFVLLIVTAMFAMNCAVMFYKLIILLINKTIYSI
ncbi:hypothetical protein [Apilactobacillus quenuiae]|uniref:hypothetical protein n=1 Tax=Apilactobacillus quenuiae TaxID=2008377 RepID=UPI000D01A471|nr:hypothetical protein [Apilactobacillus quenuiae]